ncbi:MAG: hypothetical protein HFI31_13995 [Lachnospiraceae bacterium]|nr:hypothetical protein [Lachnospiraceae bacterium]
MNIDFKKSIVIAAISAIVGGIITGLFSLLIFSLGNYTTQTIQYINLQMETALVWHEHCRLVRLPWHYKSKY